MPYVISFLLSVVSLFGQLLRFIGLPTLGIITWIGSKVTISTIKLGLQYMVTVSYVASYTTIMLWLINFVLSVYSQVSRFISDVSSISAQGELGYCFLALAESLGILQGIRQAMPSVFGAVGILFVLYGYSLFFHLKTIIHKAVSGLLKIS